MKNLCLLKDSRLIVCIFFLGCSLNVFCQKVHTITYGSPLYMKFDERPNVLGNYILKDSLPDGKWVVVAPNSSQQKAGRSTDIVIEAYYFNGNKNGLYTVYDYRKQNKEIALVSTSITTYKEGILDGSYQLWNDSFLVERGQFVNGKKNGEWQSNDRVKKTILLYRSDTLLSKEVIANGKTIANWSLTTNLYTGFDQYGHVASQTRFSPDEDPITFKYHSNDSIAESGYGQFMDVDILAAYESIYNVNTWLWRNKIGKWKYYDNLGNLIKEE